jgi:hypothetical protein
MSPEAEAELEIVGIASYGLQGPFVGEKQIIKTIGLGLDFGDNYGVLGHGRSVFRHGRVPEPIPLSREKDPLWQIRTPFSILKCHFLCRFKRFQNLGRATEKETQERHDWDYARFK